MKKRYMYTDLQCFTVIFGDCNAMHLSFQEPNLSHERFTQSTIAFFSFPDIYSVFKAGEGIRLLHVIWEVPALI